MAREIGMPPRDIATVLGNRNCRGDTMIRFWGLAPTARWLAT